MESESSWMTVDLGSAGVVSGEPEHVLRAVSCLRAMQEQERAWVVDLRARGVRAAHPDDGWVNRELNRIHLCYPQFGSCWSLEVGDVMALGSSFDLRPPRLVRVTGFKENWIAQGIFPDADRWWIYFEEITS